MPDPAAPNQAKELAIVLGHLPLVRDIPSYSLHTLPIPYQVVDYGKATERRQGRSWHFLSVGVSGQRFTGSRCSPTMEANCHITDLPVPLNTVILELSSLASLL